MVVVVNDDTEAGLVINKATHIANTSDARL